MTCWCNDRVQVEVKAEEIDKSLDFALNLSLNCEGLMRITFWGAAQEVTGSMHLIEINGARILLDCGMYQGKRSDRSKRYRRGRAQPCSYRSLRQSAESGQTGFSRPCVVFRSHAQPMRLHVAG
jgi:hypothetical protein